jgi:hypothetical protein
LRHLLVLHRDGSGGSIGRVGRSRQLTG